MRLTQDWFESWVWLDNIVPAKKARAQEDAIMGSWRSVSWWISKDCPAAAIWTTAIEGEQKSYAFLSIVDPSQLPDSHLVCIIHMLLGSFYSLLGSVWSELWVTHPIIYGKWQQMFHFCFFVPLPFKKKTWHVLNAVVFMHIIYCGGFLTYVGSWRKIVLWGFKINGKYWR